MKFIVHIGMPKSGSTALQYGLSAMRPAFARQGILYPISPVIPNTSNFLLAGVLPFDDLPRYLRQSIGKHKGDYTALYARWTDQIRAQAAETRADTVILSGENLYNIVHDKDAVKLRDELVALGATSIEIVVYVRKPSDWYLSAVQQVLRASHLIRQAGSVRYRQVIEVYAAHVSPDVKVFEYNRRLFPGEDILAHFLQAVVGIQAEAVAPEVDRQFNGTISAEGMSILRDYRLVNHKDDNSHFTKDTSRFRRAIAEADERVGGDQRPALLPDMKDRIDHGSPDILWLRDTYGIVFSDIDYDRISDQSWAAVAKTVDDICAVDKKRRFKVLNTAIFLLSTAAIPGRRAAPWAEDASVLPEDTTIAGGIAAGESAGSGKHRTKLAKTAKAGKTAKTGDAGKTGGVAKMAGAGPARKAARRSEKRSLAKSLAGA